MAGSGVVGQFNPAIMNGSVSVYEIDRRCQTVYCR